MPPQNNTTFISASASLSPRSRSRIGTATTLLAALPRSCEPALGCCRDRAGPGWGPARPPVHRRPQRRHRDRLRRHGAAAARRASRLHVHWVVLSATPSARRGASERRRLPRRRRVAPTSRWRRSARATSRTSAPRSRTSSNDLRQRAEPDLVLCHHRHDEHQDHRTVAQLAWNTFRNHLIAEYEIPKYEGDLGHPNVFVAARAETSPSARSS